MVKMHWYNSTGGDSSRHFLQSLVNSIASNSPVSWFSSVINLRTLILAVIELNTLMRDI